jgi:hypothetical protein
VGTTLNRAVAALALTAILGCSGLGLCWREFGGGHDCCVDDATISGPARSCASAATAVSFQLLSPPVDSVSIVPDRPGLAFAATALPALAPSFHVKAPTLVLRI